MRCVAIPLLMSVAAAQHLVVPAAEGVMDGNSRMWIAGTIQPHRQLTLLDASLLQPLVGRTLTGLSFRRDAGDEEFTGGDAVLAVELSHALRLCSDASERFGDNHGLDRTLVFAGRVVLPASPPAPGPAMSWTPANVLAIAFQVPFVYQGGTLAVEVRGSPDAQRPASWWPADAVWQPQPGSATSVGSGCGGHGGAAGEWAFLTATNLVPGGTATFQALGPPGELALLVLAASAQAEVLELSPFGAPGCYQHVLGPLGSLLTFFGPALLPQQPALGGMALVAIRLPSSASYLGLGLGSQWLGFGAAGLYSSNAHAFALASQPPALPLTLVTAPAPAGEPETGKVLPGCGHVMRFSFE